MNLYPNCGGDTTCESQRETCITNCQQNYAACLTTASSQEDTCISSCSTPTLACQNTCSNNYSICELHCGEAQGNCSITSSNTCINVEQCVSSSLCTKTLQVTADRLHCTILMDTSYSTCLNEEEIECNTQQAVCNSSCTPCLPNCTDIDVESCRFNCTDLHQDCVANVPGFCSNVTAEYIANDVVCAQLQIYDSIVNVVPSTLQPSTSMATVNQTG